MKKYILYFCFIFFMVNLFGQNQYLKNPSFEGNNESKTLDGWETCRSNGEVNNTYNDPDFLEFYTDDIYGDTLFHKDDKTMCLLRARSEHYSNPSKDGTYEHISSALKYPFTHGNTYTLSVWLVNLGNMYVSDQFDFNISYPIRFQVFGADAYCTAKSQFKLIDTLVFNKEWQLYQLDFIPKYDYSHVYFRVFWDEHIEDSLGGKYNGIIFLDGANLYTSCKNNKLPTDTVYFKTSPLLQLNAPEGIFYTWTPVEKLWKTTEQIAILNEYTPNVKVTVTDIYNCSTDKEFKVILSCDTLYPNKDINYYNIYYKTYEDVFLTASSGVSYIWDKTKPLSGYDIQNPVMTNYDSIFNVTITDKYGCEFDEVFKVNINCDSLYQNKAFTREAQEVTYGETLILEPEHSGNSFFWNPADNLSCSNCEQIEITVYENISYSVSYTDEFSCNLTETIPIVIEFDIPNVITPGFAGDGDGKNDKFIIPVLPEGSSIKIFEKSGVLVFKADVYNETNWWNGNNFDGNPVRSGTYWYVLNMPGNSKPIKGFVFVKR